MTHATQPHIVKARAERPASTHAPFVWGGKTWSVRALLIELSCARHHVTAGVHDECCLNPPHGLQGQPVSSGNGLSDATLNNILKNGRLTNRSHSGILDVVARQVASSQRLEGVEMTSADVRKILDGRPGT